MAKYDITSEVPLLHVGVSLDNPHLPFSETLISELTPFFWNGECTMGPNDLEFLCVPADIAEIENIIKNHNERERD